MLRLEPPGQDRLTALAGSLEQLSMADRVTSQYPFFHCAGHYRAEDGWALFRPEREWAAVLGGEWRLARVNTSHQVSPSYGETVVVPASIPDTLLPGAARHR